MDKLNIIEWECHGDEAVFGNRKVFVVAKVEGACGARGVKTTPGG